LANPLWRAARIHGELLKLGIVWMDLFVVSRFGCPSRRRPWSCIV
jgi:hypothetical protein